MSKRGQGKVMFCDLQDSTGRIQLFVKIDEMGEEEYARFKKNDIGDIIGCEGKVFKTKTGEISVRTSSIVLLSKSLLPLPEKYHGLTDKEMRYRQRYVDLMVNPESKRNFIIRSQFIKYMRNYLDNMNYVEVEPPRPEHHRRRCRRPALHHPPQHSGHRYVHAHRHRAAPEAAHHRRHGPSL